MWLIRFINGTFEVGYFLNQGAHGDAWVGHRAFAVCNDAERMCCMLNGGAARPGEEGVLVKGPEWDVGKKWLEQMDAL